MATPGATIAMRITDLIGTEYATVPDASYKDLINAAFNETADMMSEDLLLKYSKNPGRLEEASEWLVEDRKILKVTRIDANSGGIERECAPLSASEFSVAKDVNSIHYATAYSPVYRLDSKNDGAASLDIFPVCNGLGQEGRIWYFSYATDSTDLIATTSALLNTSYYLPGNSIHAIVLKSCINILNSYISNQVQDEEDSEIMQMIQSQIQMLEKSYMAEMQRFVDEQSKPGSE